MKNPNVYLISSFVLSIVLSGVGGCGGGTSSTSGGGTFITGFATDRTLSSLSSEDAQRLCAKTKEFFDEDFSVSNLCRVFAVAQTLQSNPPGNQASCENIVRNCGNDDSGTVTEEAAGLNCEASPPTTSICPGSVGLYEDCVDEIAQDFQRINDRADCGALDPTLLPDIMNFFTNKNINLPKCTELKARCPSLFVND